MHASHTATDFFTADCLDDLDALALFEGANGAASLAIDWFYVDAYALSGTSGSLSIKFSSPVPALDASVFKVPNGALSRFTREMGGLIWHAVFSPAPGVFAKDNAIVLDTTAVLDVHGQRGADMAESNRYTVDTLVRAYLDPAIDVTDPLAHSLSRTLAGRYVGTIERGQRILLMIDDVAVAPEQIRVDPVARTWRYTGFVKPGLHRVSATIIDAANYFSKPVELEFEVSGRCAGADDGAEAALVGYAALLQLLTNAVRTGSGSAR
ncbi:MAG: Ig-like domain-containing protein [Gammaproteobacteria bacterium]